MQLGKFLGPQRDRPAECVKNYKICVCFDKMLYVF
jgi:hypothetical protein